jgi:uncharacterized protein Yka (UPF0111/DUF47 family)
MSARRWFLPETPDVLGMLRSQTAITVDAMDALVEWAQGDAGAADRVRMLEHEADTAKRELNESLTVALTTPLEPEDIFELSRGLDDVLNDAKNTVREAEVMHTSADPAIAEMSEHLAEGTRRLAEAFAALASGDSVAARAAADAAVKQQRHLEHVYRRAMSALVEIDDLRELAAKRELYRRVARTSERLIDVAERVWYAVLKTS